MILLKDPNNNEVDQKILDASGGGTGNNESNKTVDNELIVLTSSGLVGQVVKDLDLYASVFNEGKVREEELYGSNSPIWFHALQKDIPLQKRPGRVR